MIPPPPAAEPRNEPRIEVHADADALVSAAAARLAGELGRLQHAGRTPRLALTGGRIARRIYAALAAFGGAAAGDDGVSWDGIELWWSDERFLTPGHPERNETQAREVWLDRVPVDPAKMHPMPADVGQGLAAAAESYAADLSAHYVAGFDLALLGVGPDGHIASLFPGQPALAERQASVVPVTNSPKPPPMRTSLTLPVLNAADQVWFVVSGSDKSAVVADAVRGVNQSLPAALVHGRRSTSWLLDADAAGPPLSACARLV